MLEHFGKYGGCLLYTSGEFLTDPQMLSLSTTQIHVAEVQHLYCECKSMEKDRTLIKILEVENPASAIIFCNTKATVLSLIHI